MQEASPTLLLSGKSHLVEHDFFYLYGVTFFINYLT